MSSFKRTPKSNLVPALPPGTKLSSHQSNLLLTSYGMGSLDSLLGGGLPVGSISIFLSDKRTGYTNVAIYHYISNALLTGHKVALVGFANNPEEIMKNLPGVYKPPVIQNSKENSEDNTLKKEKEKKNDLTIAWRYKEMPKLKDQAEDLNSKDQEYSQVLDLTTQLPKDVIVKGDPLLIDATNQNIKLEDIYHQIHKLVMSEYSSKITGKPLSSRKLLRIALHMIGSPFGCTMKFEEIYRFIYLLKGLLRYAFATMVLSFPAFLFKSHETQALQAICDTSLEFRSFADNVTYETSHVKDEYQGLFYIHKSPRLNSLLSLGLKFMGRQENDLGFKLKRKRLVIETYHLPIEGGVSERKVEPSKSEKAKTGSKSEIEKKEPKKFTSIRAGGNFSKSSNSLDF